MLRVLSVLVLMALAGQSHAIRVENFVLLDQLGDAHELYYHKQAEAVVFMIQGNSCATVHDALADYKALRDEFEPLGVKFFMLNSNLQDQRASIAAEAKAHAIDMPILDDETQLIGESLAISRSGEILVLNPQSWELGYRGPINNRMLL